MNQFLESSLANLTGKTSLEQVSTEELEKLVNDYPYFSVGHVLLAKKLKIQQDPRYLKQAQKAAVYFQDPYWLLYQLEEAGTDGQELEEESDEDEVFVAPPYDIAATTQPLENQDERVLLTDGDDNVKTRELLQGESLLSQPFENINQHALPPADEVVSGILPVAETDAHAEVQEFVPITTEFSKEEIEASGELAASTLADEADEANIATETGHPEVQEFVPITTEFSKEEIEASGELAASTLADEMDEANIATETGHPEVQEFVPITTEFSKEEIEASGELAASTLADEADGGEIFSLPNEPVIEEQQGEAPGTEQLEEPEQQAEKDASDAIEGINKQKFATALSNLEEDELPEADEVNSAPLDENFSNEQMLKNIKSILDTPLSDKELATNEPLIPIDPYYTVDYFASQGIKLVLDNEPQDKLGRQLKSFTQWLKHMKKLGPEDVINDENESSAEQTVIRIADFSNIQREIVTETMAEVLEKQGKTEKAVQVYIKLSFLHPHKSAYFADKIKKLKGIK